MRPQRQSVAHVLRRPAAYERGAAAQGRPGTRAGAAAEERAGRRAEGQQGGPGGSGGALRHGPGAGVGGVRGGVHLRCPCLIVFGNV